MGHGGLEVAVAVAEVADVAWAALERRAEHSASAIAREQEFLVAEGALAHEKRENERLRAVLEEYQKALEEMQVKGGGASEGGRFSETMEPSPHDFYERLKQKVDSPEFLAKLAAGDDFPRSPDRLPVSTADDPSSWLWVTDSDLLAADTPKEERDGLGSDGYVIITHEDIVDGIACFMARYISSIPQTKAMTPQELQIAISRAFTDLERKGKLRKLWDCGKFMYSAASWGATAVGLYKNPIIVRAAMMAVWTSCCIILRLLV